MSVLTLVRHGQASLFAADYDQLSKIGEQQARALGSYWAEHGIAIDAVYCGPRVRHRRFMELVGETYAAQGRTWPEPILINELDEFDLEGFTRHLMPTLTERDPVFAKLRREFFECTIDSDRDRCFQQMFESVMRHWQSADTLEGNVETWGAFRSRVAGVIAQIRQAAARRSRTVAFTSGGVIGCTLQHALGVNDAMMRELSWRIRNASLTEFVFSADRFTLDTFNLVPHLTTPEMLTYR
jgi:broad specificity phosphatase PhoE